jgi:hypothetical protein
MFVRLSEWLGLGTEIILVQAQGVVPYVQFRRVLYMLTGACSRGYKLRSRE